MSSFSVFDVNRDGFITEILSKISFLLIIVLTLWVHREPTFLNTLALLEDFEDTPEARTADNAEYRTEDFVVGEE